MKKSTTILLIAAASALFLASIAIMTPKAVKAVVATLVRDQDQPARHPFTTFCSAILETGGLFTCTTPKIPAGEEVVIENVSFFAQANPGYTTLLPQLQTITSGSASPVVFNFIDDSRFGQPSHSAFSGSYPVRLYADPGTSIGCMGITRGDLPNTAGSALACYISGYLVSLQE